MNEIGIGFMEFLAGTGLIPEKMTFRQGVKGDWYEIRLPLATFGSMVREGHRLSHIKKNKTDTKWLRS
jgi:hypothetical protein